MESPPKINAEGKCVNLKTLNLDQIYKPTFQALSSLKTCVLFSSLVTISLSRKNINKLNQLKFGNFSKSKGI